MNPIPVVESPVAESDSGRHLARLYLLALLVQFIWALNNSLSKVALRSFPPVMLCGIRMIMASAFILPFYWRQRPHDWGGKDFWKLLGLGGIGIGLNQFFFVVGINQTSVTHAALIIPLTPILTLIISSILGQEKFTARKIVGMTLAFSGVIVLQLTKTSDQGASLVGDLLLFVGILTFAAYIVLGKRATANHSGVVVNTFGFVGSALLLAPITWLDAKGFDFGAVPWPAWTSLVYMALFSSVIGYLLYYYVLTHMEPSRISAFSYAQPIMTTSLAAILLGEPITFALLIAGALVLAGVYVTERSRWA